MIRSLGDINDEFRAEISETPAPAQDLPPQGENDDVARLISSFEFDATEAAEAADATEAAPKPEAAFETRRKPPRRVVLIVCAIAAIILVIAAAVLIGSGSAQENPPDRESGMQDGGDAEGAADDGAESKEQGDAAGGLGEDEYNSALDNLENEINEMRESREDGADTEDAADAADAAAGEAPASDGVAALYRDLIAGEYIAEAVSVAESDALSSREDRRTLIARIDARFSDNADKETVPLPSDAEINSDVEFTKLTEAANALVDSVNAGRESGRRLPEVIDLRTKAYAIYPIKVLKKLLAIDCEDFGLYCAAAEGSAAESFDSFVNAVKYRTEYLRELRYGSGDYCAELRRIGRVFAEIAEIDGIDAARKRHAAFIAACLYELAAR
jgi:hypothetical protein